MGISVQIIIPMSGFGERFRRAGYQVPKPLIEIDGKPIIAHVIDMFPGERDFIFICNQDHLNDPAYRMQEILETYCPTGRICAIPPHKLGPVHAVRQAAHLIDPKQPTVVNYCDFTCYWDWSHFKEFVAKSECAGSIPAYKGFHPHSLGSTNYAYMRELSGWVQDIQEKQPYTNDRMQEYASSGTYYFATGEIMLDALRQTMEQGLNVGGEYYVSLAYKPLLAANQPVSVYPIQHFMQWGTPQDVAEYQGWSATFRQLLQAESELPKPQGTVVIPMAGLGQRFVNEGYSVTKPLIPVSGRPMVAQAVHDLPRATRYSFVLRGDMPGYLDIKAQLQKSHPQSVVLTIPQVTEGQACTAMLGIDAVTETDTSELGPLTIGACDNGALYEPQKLAKLLSDPDIDVIVWGARGHANALRHPNMFGWIDTEGVQIKSISVKTPLSSPATDPIVIGTFTFRRASDYRRVFEHLVARDGRINGEFYIDSCINDALELGLRCTLFEVDHYISWGTPNDLRTFEYWQSCFHKWRYHPYRLELDHRIPKESLTSLNEKYRTTVPEIPIKRAK